MFKQAGLRGCTHADTLSNAEGHAVPAAVDLPFWRSWGNSLEREKQA